MNVKLFVPVQKDSVDLDSLIQGLSSSSPCLPSFDELAIDFLSEVSKNLLKKPGIKNFPELVSLAYWLRRSNISRITESFLEKTGTDEIIVPRGIAFHIAPSNVDSIFLYSWALSLLCGNKNFVRVSESISDQIELLLTVIREIIIDKKWEKITSGNLIVTYPRDNNINLAVSAVADVRVIWGGDETVSGIRSLRAKPGTKDISFADKFSYTIINASEYLKLNDNEREKLAHLFYNDSYWFDQMACSSPRFVYIAGPEDGRQNASAQFWNLLKSEVRSHNSSEPVEQSMEKLVYKYGIMADTNSVKTISDVTDGNPAVIRIGKDQIKEISEYCGGGFFIECLIDELGELATLVDGKDQTLTYFGFSKKELKNLVGEINGTGIDRIVPVGEALSFSPDWDGYSLLYELTKKVIIA